MKKATVMIWNPAEKKWNEEVFRYEHYTMLFRRLARLIFFNRKTYVLKNDKLRNLWEEWATQPMTKRDMKRLKGAEKLDFSRFTTAYIARFETLTAIRELEPIVYRAFVRKTEPK